MKQHLRSLWTLIMLLVWVSVGFAQNKVSVSTLAKSAVDTKTTGDCDAIWSYQEALALQKNGAQFNKFNGDLNVSLSEKNAVITKIVINAAQSGTIGTDNKTISIKVGGKSFGSNITLSTKKSKDYSFEGESSGNIVITLGSSTNNASIYIKTVSFTYHLGSSKKATTLTFPKSIFNIEEGNETTFAGQPAKLKTGETELNNAITYTTSNDAMFEAYDANVGPTTLKTGSYGTATVTAKFNGDNTYEASTATYTVNYTEKEKPATTLDFGFTTKTVNIDETFTAAATLKSGETAITGAVTYSSSTPKVAYVDEATGEVMALTAGKATITATFAGTSEYKSLTASYELTVVDPNAIETTFDFTKPENYDYGVSSGKDNHEGDLDDNGGQIISNGVVITSTSGNGTPNRFWYDGLRVYKNSKLVISASGYKITKITTEGGECTWTYNDNGTAVFENDPNEGSTVTLTSMTVTMSSRPQVTFTENENNDDALIINDKAIVNATLTRTLVANKWNTFCVPFETEITGTALEGATVKAVGTIEGNVINLVDATKIEAGVPYLVMPTTGDIVNPTFKSVTITEISAKEVGEGEYKFVGTYSPKKITVDEFGKIWGVTAEGKLAKINAGTTMKGLRAYFVFPTNTAAAKLNFDGETTGINNIETNATVNGKVYNLNGQYVGNSLNGLKKGIYVVNGKKVIK